MATIKEDYCSYEVAKLLKEKGFDESCRAIYEEKVLRINTLCDYRNSELSSYLCAPTHQMSMKWLREMHNINIEIFVIKNYDKKICEYTYTIMDLNFPGSDDGIDCCNKYKTYEQACEAAIKYCLKKLV